MSERKYFGTDGIRGEFGTEPMTPGFAWRVGRAVAEQFAHSHAAPLVVIGRDTRESGPVLETALVAGLRAGGAQVRLLGVLPTAAVSWLTVVHRASAGIMISASHNQWSDNGIKLFGPKGRKLPDATEAELENRIDALPARDADFQAPPLSVTADASAVDTYFEKLRAGVPAGLRLDRFSLVVDAAHGAAWGTTPEFLRSLGAHVEVLGGRPNGRNINLECGSMHPEVLASAIRGNPGRIGICHDGDADRLTLVDETGTPLDGDEILAILGLHLLRQDRLPHHTLVATIMSNFGLDEALRHEGGTVLRTAVGDRHVMEAMAAGGYALGGEQSGHILLPDFLPTGDGLLTALQVLRVVTESGRPLAELRRVMSKYPQILLGVKVREKKPLEEMPAVAEVLAAAEAEIGVRGRVNFRYSGTENKARVLLEGPDAQQLKELAERIELAFAPFRLSESQN